MSDQVATLRELYRQWPRRPPIHFAGCVPSEVNIPRRRCWRCLLLAWRSCPNLFDERWIIIAAAALVDAPGHGPHAKAVLGGWPQKLGTGHADQPKLDILLIEDHRHAVVNRPGKSIGIHDDDRARRHSPQSVVFVIRAAPSPMRARLRRAQARPAGKALWAAWNRRGRRQLTRNGANARSRKRTGAIPGAQKFETEFGRSCRCS